MYRHQQHFPGSTNRGKRYRCEFCYVVKFSEERDLNHHMKLHMEGSLFRCHICREFFKFKHRLKVHMRAHMGKTIYRCDECNYSAETRYHLNVHKRIHTGEKSFICNICKKSFSQRGSLKTHFTTIHLAPVIEENYSRQVPNCATLHTALQHNISEVMLKNHYNPTKEQQDCHVLSGVTKSQPVLDPMLQHHHNPIEERQHYHVLSGMTRGHSVFGEGKNLQNAPMQQTSATKLDPMLQHHHNPVKERQHYHVLSGMTRGHPVFGEGKNLQNAPMQQTSATKLDPMLQHPVFGEGKNLQKNSEYNILESSYGNSAQGLSASTLSVSLLPCDQCKMSFPGEIDLINHLLIHELENLKHGGDRDEPILICKPTF